MAALADLALRRPIVLLVATLAVLATAVIVAAGAPGHLGVGAASSDGSSGASAARPDLVVATTGKTPVRSGPYRVALRVISAQLSSDAGVESVRRGPVSGDGRSTSLIVTLVPGDDAADQRVGGAGRGGGRPWPVEGRLRGPGSGPPGSTARHLARSLEARAGRHRDRHRRPDRGLGSVARGRPRALRRDRDRRGAGRIAGRWSDCRPFADRDRAGRGDRARDRDRDAMPDDGSLQRRGGVRPARRGGAALGYRDRRHCAADGRGGSARGAAGLVATGLDQAPSMLLASLLAAFLAIASALVLRAGAAFPRRAGLEAGSTPSSRASRALASVPRRCAGFLADSRLRAALAGVIAVALMVAAGLPSLDGQSRDFSAAELPAGSEAADGHRFDRRATPGWPPR